MGNGIFIRPERREDIDSIRQINGSAFPSQAEARLVDLLRAGGKLIISLLAEADGVPVGHIAFSPVSIEGHSALRGLGLGPMAVTPEMQRRGIGSLLVTDGLKSARNLGYSFAVVLGHPRYYPRFGFRPAVQFGIRCQWKVPDDVFMAMELREGALAGVRGLASYEPEFNEV